jgi:hypothetical protein
MAALSLPGAVNSHVEKKTWSLSYGAVTVFVDPTTGERTRRSNVLHHFWNTPTPTEEGGQPAGAWKRVGFAAHEVRPGDVPKGRPIYVTTRIQEYVAEGGIIRGLDLDLGDIDPENPIHSAIPQQFGAVTEARKSKSHQQGEIRLPTDQEAQSGCISLACWASRRSHAEYGVREHCGALRRSTRCSHGWEG